MVSGLENFLPYAFALLIAIPILVLIRQFVYSFIALKEKELKMLGLQAGNESRVQAYERMTLFLERIKPANLVTRFDQNLNPHEFVFLTEKSIQEEYDYNASQQLYIGKISWQNIVNDKSKLIQMLHTTLEAIGNKSTLEEYKTVFLMSYINEGDFILENIEEWKKEFLLLNFKN